MTTPTDFGPRRPYFSCVLPMATFLVLGLAEPVPSGGGLAGQLGIPYGAYPWVYATRIAGTSLAIAACLPYLRNWLGRATWWPPLLGLVLVIPWIVFSILQREAGLSGLSERSAFNPFDRLTPSEAAWAFLAVRFFGLAVIVPFVEELFLRGFLMRFVIREAFWTVPFGTLTLSSAAACLVYAGATHPSEAVASVGWFAMVSGIAAATRKPIDAILAHAATNLALGAYVLATGAWWLL